VVSASIAPAEAVRSKGRRDLLPPLSLVAAAGERELSIYVIQRRPEHDPEKWGAGFRKRIMLKQ
jgi:hypothetical protein